MSLVGVPAATYSIVAIDRDAGLIGAAVQSHFFSVGSVVPWVLPGVGAVVTQSVVNVEFGPEGLKALQAGTEPAVIVDQLLQNDSSPAVRQVVIMNAAGTLASHTGDRCIAEAGHVATDGLSTQANMMDEPGVPEAMAVAFRSSSEPLPERLLAALEAAEQIGGDVRGRQSAALIVVRVTPTGTVQTDRPFDLRVEDDPDPLVELRRLLRLQHAYHTAEAGDVALAHGHREEAQRAYQRARTLAPEKTELQFWHAVATAENGDIATGRKMIEEIEQSDIITPGRWHRLGARLPQTGLFRIETVGWDAVLSPVPGRLYHVLTIAELEAYGFAVPISLSAPIPRPESLVGELTDESLEREGFIHCSFRFQIEGVVRRHYPNEERVFLAEIEPENVGVPLRIEDSYDIGEAYPHLYGAVPFESVIRLIPSNSKSGSSPGFQI